MENTLPKVSVITPAYNAEKYIAQAIESILNQTFKDFEYIIIDDCSTDSTWKIIQEYAKEDARIIALKNEKNLGIAGNRNKGTQIALGKYIIWQDADDISMLTRIEKQFRFMEENSEVGIAGSYMLFFSEIGDSGVRKYLPDDVGLRKTVFRYSPVAQPSAIVRKKCLDEFGPYDLEMPPAEDLDMSFKIGSKYKFANLQEALVKYRENPGSATFTKLKRIELNTIKIRKKYSKGYGYKMSITDNIYNFLQYLSIYIIPPKIKIELFNLIRNSR